ncbi:MAG TPA: four helix bundle protein [Gemmatimonadaceae bacterium]|nr:four helix bundle protein [Gemmatimonadaceae bacterium]
MGDFKKLRVWHESKDLTKDVFRVADKIEGTSARILRDQACRAMLSVPANIAEGSAKSSDREFARFVKIATGSLTELESHLIIGQEIGIISHDDYVPMMDKLIEVSRKLTGLLTTLIASAEEAQRQKTSRRRKKE